MLIGSTLGYDLNKNGFPAADDSFDNMYNEAVDEAADEKVCAETSNKGIYTPDRELPTDKHGVPLPDSELPHPQLGRSKPKYGAEPQAREWDYGSSGKLQPQRDIDFTDHGHPDAHPDVPHQHKLTPNNPRIAPKGGFRRGKGEPF